MTDVRVRVADLAAAAADATLSTSGLGSCVAIALLDRAARVGGLAHILLPSPALSHLPVNPARCPATAVPLLVERMRALGARPGRLVAKIAGGACMFASLVPASNLPIGERNLIATRAALLEAAIPIVAEDVGGTYGRSARLTVATGALDVRSITRGHVTL